MTYRTFRRRVSETLAAHDWLEAVSILIGLVFLGLALACAWGIVTALTGWGNADPGFDPSGQGTTIGFLKVTRAFGVVLFALFGFLALGVGWFLAGDWIRRLVGRVRRRT